MGEEISSEGLKPVLGAGGCTGCRFFYPCVGGLERSSKIIAGEQGEEHIRAWYLTPLCDVLLFCRLTIALLW